MLCLLASWKLFCGWLVCCSMFLGSAFSRRSFSARMTFMLIDSFCSDIFRREYQEQKWHIRHIASSIVRKLVHGCCLELAQLQLQRLEANATKMVLDFSCQTIKSKSRAILINVGCICSVHKWSLFANWKGTIDGQQYLQYLTLSFECFMKWYLASWNPSERVIWQAFSNERN